MASQSELTQIAEALWDLDANRVPRTHIDIDVQARPGRSWPSLVLRGGARWREIARGIR
jgi:hypothetical protein